MNIADNRPHVPPILEARNITAGYGDVTVLRGVTIEVPAASVVAVLGPNGAGKTTLLRVLTGLVTPRDGQLFLAGKDVTGARPHSLVRRGLCHIPEGRGVFPSLTVRENLVLAAPRGARTGAMRSSEPWRSFLRCGAAST
jgi:branched-chain amino acid transport system ATP-binding protein